MEDALPNLLCLRVDEQLYLGKSQPQWLDHCIGQVKEFKLKLKQEKNQ